MTDLAKLKADYDAAEETKASLVDERRANREVMTRAEFVSYSEGTISEQREVQKAVVATKAAFSKGLGKIKDDAIAVALGTITETEGGG